MLVKIADWATDRYDEFTTWAEERFGSGTSQADIVILAGRITFIVAAATAVITVLWLAVGALTALVGGIGEGMATGLATGLSAGLGRIADWSLTEVVTTPVHAYITAHAVGLPTDGETIWAAWQLAGPVLWLLCWLARSWGARLAWVLYGIATVAMVYAASPVGGRWLAAGITVMYWGLLSVLAFRGVGRRPAASVHVLPSTAQTDALRQLREELGEVRTRVERVEAAGDELAARRGEA
ncbi:hypothetical protein HS048_33975 [Planomonospora sp. ID91781]|uniref:hypothetical protein n=1 Tax=Planomonospora sp. ID91781 TaxID=2738135 RepID=UPI0018C3BC03|nr:hypothetical protein [Planomonospora sp. ID91781]MBG0825695.1 hypothetical protein [Planomonospora sp. ID91781]